MIPVLYKNSKNTYEKVPENVPVVDDLMEIAKLIEEWEMIRWKQ